MTMTKLGFPTRSVMNLKSFCFVVSILLLCQLQQCSAQACVSTLADLNARVQTASTNVTTPTVISLCSSRIAITNALGFGIDVSGKSIILNCTLPATNAKCILDGRSNTRIFYGKTTALSLERIRLINGYAINGGAIYLEGNSTLNIGVGCTFSGNRADNLGGAIFLTDRAILTITGGGIGLSSPSAVIFQQNTASYGSAISVTGISIQSTNNVHFLGNEAESTIRVASILRATFVNTRIYENDGRGLDIGAVNEVVLDKISVYSNRGPNCAGVSVVFAQKLTFTNSSIYSNYALDYGGGFCAVGILNTTLNKVSFNNNTALGNGGGFYHIGDTIQLTWCSFSTNFAGNLGGGIYMQPGTLTISSMNMNANIALGSGSAFYSDGGYMSMYKSNVSNHLNTPAFDINNAEQLYSESNRFVRNQIRAMTASASKVILFGTTFIPAGVTTLVPGFQIYMRGGGTDVSCLTRSIFCASWGLFNDQGSLDLTTDCLKRGIVGTSGIGSCRV